MEVKSLNGVKNSDAIWVGIRVIGLIYLLIFLIGIADTATWIFLSNVEPLFRARMLPITLFNYNIVYVIYFLFFGKLLYKFLAKRSGFDVEENLTVQSGIRIVLLFVGLKFLLLLLPVLFLQIIPLFAIWFTGLGFPKWHEFLCDNFKPSIRFSGVCIYLMRILLVYYFLWHGKFVEKQLQKVLIKKRASV